MRDELHITISSPSDREKLVAEIFFGSNQWAEMNQEKGHLQVEFYPRSDGKTWDLDYFSVMRALQEAKLRLTGA